jgi:hypothetical protein
VRQGPREKDSGATAWTNQKDLPSSFALGTCRLHESLLRFIMPPQRFVQSLPEKWWTNWRDRTIAAVPFLANDRLAKLNAPAADIHLARPLDERPRVGVAFAAERAVGIPRLHNGEKKGDREYFSILGICEVSRIFSMAAFLWRMAKGLWC